MAFQLEAGETLAAGLGRIAAEEIERARNCLLAPTEPEAGVLEARKSLKKVRSILRLTRKPLGKRRFRDENRRYRDLARRSRSSVRGWCGWRRWTSSRRAWTGRLPCRSSRPRATPRAATAAVRRRERAGRGGSCARGVPAGIEASPSRGSEPSVRASPARIARAEADARSHRDAVDRGVPRLAKAREGPVVPHAGVRPARPETFGTIASELHLLSDYLGTPTTSTSSKRRSGGGAGGSALRSLAPDLLSRRSACGQASRRDRTRPAALRRGSGPVRGAGRGHWRTWRKAHAPTG